MKRVLVILAFLIIAASLPMMIPCDNKIYAVSGCCMERDSNRDSWYRNGLDFRQCETRNQSRDGDNVFDRRGLVWWNVECR